MMTSSAIKPLLFVACCLVFLIFYQSCTPKEASKAETSTEKPNIIIIKTDQQRYDLLGVMGHSIVKTPNLDKLASKAFVLKNEFTVSPICVPSRTSFFTGKYVHRTGNVFNAPKHHLHKDEWTFIEPLKEEGYKVGLAGKNHTFSENFFETYFDYREETGHFGKEFGNITESDLKVREYLTRDPRPGNEKSNMLLEGLVEGPMPFPAEQCPAFRIAEDGIDFVRQFKSSPFLLYFSFGDPHWPTIAPEPYYSMYKPEDLDLPASENFDWEGHPFKHFVQSRAMGSNDYTLEEKRRILATYYGQITMVDYAIGRLIDELEKLELIDNTIIVFTSDHGDWAGNYGLVAKTGGFHESLVRIPGIIYLPKLAARGKEINAEISNIDILPTIFDYIGMEVPKEVQGLSFLDVLNGQKKKHRTAIFAEVGNITAPPAPMSKEEFPAYAKKRVDEEGMFWFIDYTTNGRNVMIRKGDWKYNYYTGDINELYNFKEDPLELNNLIDQPAYAEKQKELKDELIEWLLTEPVKGLK